MVNADVYWRAGFRKRKRVFSLSAAMIVFYLHHEEILTLQIFLVTLTVLLLEFCLRRLFARNKFLSNLVRPGVVILVIINILLLVSLNHLLQNFAALYVFIPHWFLRAVLLASLIAIVPFPLYFGIKDSWKSYSRERRFGSPTVSGFAWRIVVGTGVYLVFCSILFLSEDLFVVPLLALALLLLVSNPNNLLSQQRANLQYIFKHFREARIQRLISSNAPSINPLARLLKIANFFTNHSTPWLLLITTWIFGSFLLPIYLYLRDIERDLLVLMAIGIFSGLMFTTLAMIYWFIQITPKHIVIPFKVVKAQEDPGLEVIANLITQSFVDRLKNISLLLDLRQVENLSLRSNGGLAVFVTSGQDQELIEQVRILGNIETKDVKIPFGNLIAPLLSNLVETRVRGTIQRKEDRTIAIWVEYQKRGGRTVAVDMAILPENSALDIDRNTINEIAFTLAVKLVFNLGEHAHLASSWRSLKLFLQGLDAAYHHNWWHAIASYRKAVHMEESTRNSFGYGYYHLGVMLLFQGDVNQGMKYLTLSEKTGPPLPETQYMLALGRFYQFKNGLHITRTVFADIVISCQSALKLRPDFPEAYHLLGTAYYQRGRLRERAYTRHYKDRPVNPYKIDPVARGYADDYHKSLDYFHKAINYYDRAIQRLPGDIKALSSVFDEKARLVQDRMSATHRIADALRCLDRFAEAVGFYQEMLCAYSQNGRTLIDIAKTYCLAGNWGQADQFLRTDVFNRPELAWNKSANFYMGWSLIGGLAENGDPFIRSLDWLIGNYEKVGNRGIVTNVPDAMRLLNQAVDHLDFAYQQYPAYTFRWRQLDWLPAFDEVLKYYRKDCLQSQEACQVYKSVLDPESCNIGQLRYWLAWRVVGNAYIPDINILELAKSIAGTRLDPAETPLASFQPVFEELLALRQNYYQQLILDEECRSVKNVKRRHNCLVLAERGRRQLTDVKEYIKLLVDGKNQAEILFEERWAIDVYAELSLFTIKLLVEGKAYEYARDLAHEAGMLMGSFVASIHNEKSASFFTPLGRKVASYQLSSLYAWEAFSLIAILDDIATQARLNASDGKKISDEHLHIVESLISQSKSLVPIHPLAIYSLALLNKKLGLFRVAADDLIELIQSISPLDPHKYLSRETIKSSVSRQTSLSEAVDLSKREHIHGRLQFESVVNPTQIHIALASIFVSLNELHLVADHLMLAISDCPYEDTIAELFLDLTHIFDQQNRFDEAMTASEEAKNLHLSLTPFDHQMVKRLEPFILECVLTTNLGEYSAALEKANQLKDVVHTENFIESHKTLIQEIKQVDCSVQSPLLDQILAQYLRDLAKMRKGVESDAYKKLARLCLRADKLAAYLKDANDSYSTDMIGKVMASQAIALFSRDLFERIVFTCDLYNSSAFNWAELNFNLDVAQQDAQKNIYDMQNLLRSVVPDSPKTNSSAVNADKRLQNLLDPLTWATTNYEKRLANYIDTLAWVLFRDGKPESLQEAFDILNNVALRYDSGLGIVHYHLARVCIGQLEIIWQETNNDARGRKTFPQRSRTQVRLLLRQAFLYWRQAQKLDTNYSLHSRLQWVSRRLESYRENWLAYQLPA